MFKEIPATQKAINCRKKVYGVGINDIPYKITYVSNGQRITCPFYLVWYSMLQRCYSSILHKKHPTYANCTIHLPWLRLSIFKAWMQLQDYQNKRLDKDIIIKGNKHYSPATCIFVTHTINNLFTARDSQRGKLPLGVSAMTVRGITYYVASCSFYGKQERLGYFKHISEAEQVYLQTKKNYILEIAQNTTDIRLKNALIQHVS